MKNIPVNEYFARTPVPATTPWNRLENLLVAPGDRC